MPILNTPAALPHPQSSTIQARSFSVTTHHDGALAGSPIHIPLWKAKTPLHSGRLLSGTLSNHDLFDSKPRTLCVFVRRSR